MTLFGSRTKVAGMRIGMVNAMREDHLEVQFGTLSGE